MSFKLNHSFPILMLLNAVLITMGIFPPPPPPPPLAMPLTLLIKTSAQVYRRRCFTIDRYSYTMLSLPRAHA